MLPSKLYTLIKPARQKLNFSLQKVVGLAEITDTAYLSKVENGKIGCTMETLDKIFKVLNIELQEQVAALSVSVRQNSKGNWWCNTTHNGYDLFEEGVTIEEAKVLITNTLIKRGLSPDSIQWGIPKLYPSPQPIPNSYVGYRSWRVDKGMV